MNKTVEDLKQDLIDTATGFLSQRDIEKAEKCVQMYCALVHTRMPFGLGPESGAALPGQASSAT